MDGKEIAREINIKLAELGMTKTTLEQLTGVSRASISQWARGKAKPSADALAKINACLGTSFSLQSRLSDNMYETIGMLQEMRDCDRVLLDAARAVDDEGAIYDIAKFLRRLKRSEESDAD